MVDSRASCFLFKNFFRHIHEHCRYLSLFCFSDTFGFLVNGSWSHDKLSAPYFVPCCTESISIIEIDHSLHCYHWMHFTKQLWEKVPTTTRHNCYCSFTKPDQFFQKELRQFLFIWYGHATTKKVSHKVDETECRWAKCAPSEGNSDGTSGAPLRALSGRLRCLVVCLWASRNRTFTASVVAASGFVWQKIAL